MALDHLTNVKLVRNWLVGASLGALVFLVFCGPSATAAVPAANRLQQFMSTSNAIFTGSEDSFLLYVKLRQQYLLLDGQQRRQAGQILSMIDAMFGRYKDASIHFRESFPGFVNALTCPPGGVVENAKSVVRQFASRSRVLIFNESHSEIATRAFLIEVLPLLRKAGYRKLALEAIYPSVGEPGASEAIMSRGFPVDSSKEGFYLREPVYGELVRTALRLGFELVEYESEATAREEREEDQASTLARAMLGSPNEKMVVLAGYSHAWKSGGWMAERLNRKLVSGVISVDQVSGLAGCVGGHNSFPKSVAITIYGHAWSSRSDVDVTLLRNVDNDRRDSKSWLRLGGIRRQVILQDGLCQNRRPCLLEAVLDKEAADAVPVDRVVLTKTVERPVLFISPGAYQLHVRSLDSGMRYKLFVYKDGSSKAVLIN
jgi:hypothetical protein